MTTIPEARPLGETLRAMDWPEAPRSTTGDCFTLSVSGDPVGYHMAMVFIAQGFMSQYGHEAEVASVGRMKAGDGWLYWVTPRAKP